MIATHEIFKHPLQIDPNVTYWQAAELVIASPIFFARIHCASDEMHRDFIVSNTETLASFVGPLPFGELVSIQMLRAPSFNQGAGWSLQEVKSVKRQVMSGTDYPPTVYVVDEDGRLCCSHIPGEIDPHELELHTLWSQGGH